MGIRASHPGDDHSSRTFVGREFELSRLNQSLERAVDGTITAVLVQGAPQVGKTAFVRRFQAAVDVDHVHLDAQGGDGDRNLGPGVVEQLLSSVPGLAAVADRGTNVENSDGHGSPHPGRRLLRVLDRLQEEKLVIVEIDDMHSSDQETVRVLEYLLRRPQPMRLLVLLTSRIGEVGHAELVNVVREVDGCVVTIEGLSIAETRELASDVGVGRLSAAAARRLSDLTSGRPADLLSILRAVPLDVLSNTVGRLPAPASARGRIAAMLDDLSPHARNLLAGVAVHGVSSTIGAAEFTGDVVDLRSALAEAEGAGLIDVDVSLGRSTIRFRDATLSLALYESMGVVERAAAHERAVEVTEDPRAALLHRVCASLRSDESLAAEVEAAAEQGAMRGQTALAADLLVAAANLSGSRDSYERRAFRAVELLVAAYEVERAVTLLDEIGVPIDEIGHTYLLGCVELGVGRLRESREYLELARDRAIAANRARLADKCTGHLMVLACRACRFDKAFAHLQVLGDHSPTMTGFETVPFDVWRWIPQATGGPDPVGEGLRHFSLGQSALMTGDSVEARAHFSRAVEDFETHQADLLSAVSTGYLALAEFYLGRWDEAVEHFEVAIADLDSAAVEPAPSLGLFLELCARVHAARGHWIAAERCAERIAGMAGQRSERMLTVFALAAGADIAWGRGDNDRVVELLEPVRELVEKRPHLWHIDGIVDYYLLWARASISLGQADRINTGEATVARSRMFGSRGEALSLHIRALVASSARRHDEATQLFIRALSLSDGARPLDLAHLEFSYGAHLRRRGLRSQATAMLSSALTRFRSLGATPDADRCELEIEACGRGGRSALSGDVLTPRELSVAELVALGQSNQRVADALYVSRRTVEYHMSNVLRKLGLSSRTEVADALSLVQGTDLGVGLVNDAPSSLAP